MDAAAVTTNTVLLQLLHNTGICIARTACPKNSMDKAVHAVWQLLVFVVQALHM